MIIENAVPLDIIDALITDIDNAYANLDSRYLVQTGYGQYVSLQDADRNRALNKLLDVYVFSEAGRRTSLSPKIVQFLRAIFEDHPVAFQNLTFEVGSTQAIHQDTAYVVVHPPLALAASWIALEDIQPGSGELVYYPGSHRFGPFFYPDNRKHWIGETDGHDIHNHHLWWLNDQARMKGIEKQSFRPKKGDALIWAADLAHGGGVITDPSLTRRSYVTHYCPRYAEPHYRFQSGGREPLIAVEGGYVVSSHYDISRLTYEP